MQLLHQKISLKFASRDFSFSAQKFKEIYPDVAGAGIELRAWKQGDYGAGEENITHLVIRLLNKGEHRD